jgi:hypothetical protein
VGVGVVELCRILSKGRLVSFGLLNLMRKGSPFGGDWGGRGRVVFLRILSKIAVERCRNLSKGGWLLLVCLCSLLKVCRNVSNKIIWRRQDST